MPSDKTYLALTLLAIVGGFAAVGGAIKTIGPVTAGIPGQAAQSVADYLRGDAASIEVAGAANASLKTQAQSCAEAVADLLKSNLPVAVAGDTEAPVPNRIQAAAEAVATQLNGQGGQRSNGRVTSTSPDTNPAMTKMAASSLADWLNSIAGGTTPAVTPDPTAAKQTVPSAQPGAGTAPPTAQSTLPAAPVEPVKTAAEPMPTAGTSASAAAAQASQALKDRAADMAAAASKEFGTILSKLPADGSAPSPTDTAGTLAETPATVAFSSLRYDATGSDSGLVTISGRAKPGSKVSVFLDGAKLATTPTANNGRWLIATPQKLPIGQHLARADVLDAAGKTAESTAYPFAREAAVAAGQESVIVPLTVAALTVQDMSEGSVAAGTPIVVIKPPTGVPQPPLAPAAPVIVAEAPAAPVVKADVVAPAIVAAPAETAPVLVAQTPDVPSAKAPIQKLAAIAPQKLELRRPSQGKHQAKRRVQPVKVAAKARKVVVAAKALSRPQRRHAVAPSQIALAPKTPAAALSPRVKIASVKPVPARHLVQLTTQNSLVLVRVFHGKRKVLVKVPAGILRAYAAAPQPYMRPIRKRRLRRR